MPCGVPTVYVELSILVMQPTIFRGPKELILSGREIGMMTLFSTSAGCNFLNWTQHSVMKLFLISLCSIAHGITYLVTIHNITCWAYDTATISLFTF